jgi:ferredoxin
MRVRIAPRGFEFDAAPGQTLLRAADAAGIELPSSCRNGTCRTCICRLRAGHVRHTVDWPGLSAEEKVEGWILPCVAEPLSDVVLEVPAAFSVFGD